MQKCHAYDGQRDRLREEITIAELELNDAGIETIDVEGVLGFAEHLLSNAARLWLEATLEQRRELQHAIFPDGLPFDGKNCGTAATCLMFRQLQTQPGDFEDVASPAGFEPAVSALKGQRVGPATPWGRLEKAETGRS